MQKMLDDFQRERLEAESKADKLVNDLGKAVELKRSLQSQDQMREVKVQKEALEPKTNPEPINQQIPVLEDSPSFTPSQKPESITTLARATVVMLPKSLPRQVTTSVVVQKMDVAWMIPHGNRRTLQNLEELPLHSEEARKKFLTWGNTKMLQPPMVLDPAYLDELGHWQDIDEFLYNPKGRILLFLQAPASLEVTIEFLCSLRFLNDREEVKSTAEVTSTTKLTFTLMGRLLSLTVADLGWLIGLYTLDETRSLEFANLPDRLDPEFDVKNYFGRSHGPDVVFDSDMLFFWSLEARVPVNLATFVARFLFAQSTCNHQFVLCGPMVTLLARGLCMTVPNVLPEAASMFRPSTRYLTQIAYNKEDKEARPRKQHTIPMTLRELSQAMFAFQDSVDSRLRSMETLLLTQQWQKRKYLNTLGSKEQRRPSIRKVLNKPMPDSAVGHSSIAVGLV
ncbi:unnamed protein product [Cuscuta campestris]|uniref:Uncharacterized protein n=1 Tax=Cuscuta campestris TaxID=132261 RepID=A0A484MB08_9ASTE|nr:unnamed protein product [Cuscuta campestris]